MAADVEARLRIALGRERERTVALEAALDVALDALRGHGDVTTAELVEALVAAGSPPKEAGDG